MRRIALLFLLALPAMAQTPYGRLQFQLQNAQGQAISGATVYVYPQSDCGVAAGSTPATVYATATGTTVTQPVYTDGFGQAYAYAPQGCYTVVYYSPYTGTITQVDQNAVAATNISPVGGPFCPLTGPCVIAGQVTASRFNGPLTGNVTTTSAIGNSVKVVARGDSLTQGYQGTSGYGTSAGDYPNQLRKSMGTEVVNDGVSGNTSTQIAVRSGAVATTATVGGGVIAACTLQPCAGVTVTFPAGYEPVTSLGPVYGTAGTISGIHGSVTYSGGTLTFTPDVVTAGATVASAPFVVDKPYTAYIPIIWSGRNNYADPTTVQSDIAAMVAQVPVGQTYLVLSVINGDLTNEWSGGSVYNQIVALNTALAATYGTKFIDVRAALVAAYNPLLPVDVTDHSRDVPPSSLHAITAIGTLTANINTTDTSFTTSTSGGTLATGNILIIDSEAMRITNIVGTTVTVSRNYGGTLASHTSGTAFTSTDYLHLNANGYALVAAVVKTALDAAGYPRNVALTQASAPATANSVPVFLLNGSNTSVGELAMDAGHVKGNSNTAFGFAALQDVDFGVSNTAVGFRACAAVTTASKNVCMGHYAGLTGTGFSNTIVGDFAGALATGNTNTFIGASAGTNNTVTGSTFVGYQAGNANSSGSGNTYMGTLAGTNNTVGIANTIIGYQALSTAVTGSGNTAVGWNALQLADGAATATAVGTGTLQNLTATGNVGDTAIGNNALNLLTTGLSSTAVGYGALGDVTTSSFNTALGANAGRLVTGDRNTFLGSLSGFDFTTASSITAVGYHAGYNSGTPLQTSTNSVFLGNTANTSVDGLTNNIVIGDTAQATTSNTAVIGNSSLTDVYLGSVSGLAAIHASNIPSAFTYSTPLINWCGGTVGTANATVYYLNPASMTTACTSTTNSVTPTSGATGTITSCYAVAGTAGAVVGSGILNFVKKTFNGTAYTTASTTAICTLGTGTVCSNTGLSIAMATTNSYPDAWAVTVTTGQATDTTANIHVTCNFRSTLPQ